MDSFKATPAGAASRKPAEPARPPQPFRGAVINAKYTLIDRRSAGGMGEIWEARRNLTAHVAVKFLRVDRIRNPADRDLLTRLFNDEVAHLLALQGGGEPTGIVTLLDSGVWQAPGGGPGLPYFVMPVLEARPLDEALAPREPRDQLKCFRKVCEAVGRVHARRRLHLDLKPDNILVVEKNGQLDPVVVDFGLAVPFQPGLPMPALCVGRGTPLFMAPEQWSRGAGEISPATDVWALGVTLFQLLTRRHPCGLENKRTPAARRRAILAGPSRSLVKLRPDLPGVEALSALLDRTLAVKPDDRFADAGQLARALRQLRGGGPAQPPPSKPAPRRGPKPVPPAAVAPAPGAPVRKTIVELDLTGYSDLARELEENLNVQVVALLNDQVQGFVDAGLQALGIPRERAVLGTAGDNAFVVFDQPEQAHRFARAFFEAVKAHNARKTVASAKRGFRLGATTGDILFTTTGGRPAVVGITISNAVRLESAAQPGELIVDLATFQGLPPELQQEYGPEETVCGKRNEQFQARRCVMLPAPAAVPQEKPKPDGSKPPRRAKAKDGGATNTQSGSGGQAVGQGNVAAGKKGIAVGGDFQGNVTIN